MKKKRGGNRGKEKDGGRETKEQGNRNKEDDWGWRSVFEQAVKTFKENIPLRLKKIEIP